MVGEREPVEEGFRVDSDQGHFARLGAVAVFQDQVVVVGDDVEVHVYLEPVGFGEGLWVLLDLLWG